MRSRPSGSVTRRPRLRAGLLAGAVVAVPLYLSAGAAQSAATVAKFTPTADAYVDQSQAKANFGTRSALRTDASPVVRSYLRFSVANLAGEVSKATLRILPKASSAAGVSVRPVGGTWGEKTITWANAPAPATTGVPSGALTAGTWTSIDVTALVAGNGAVNLALVGPAGGAVGYPSREASTNQPQLVVETIAATTTTTAPPTTTTTVPPTTTTTTAPPSSGKLPTGCSVSLNVRQATANVLGYLFGDGHWGTSGYNYAARDSCKETRMKNDLQTIGVHFTLSSGHFTIAPAYPFDQPQDFGASPWMASASSDEIKFFLAAVLEGEGSGSGKVLDDPGWGRTSAIVGLYKRLNVVVVPDHPAPACGCETDGTYWNTYVDPSAPTSVYNGYIDIIHSFPSAETGRVPNYR